MVGKKDLCALLGWSRPKLDRVLERDGLFPILKRGIGRGQWEFSVDAVIDYINGVGNDAKAASPETQKDGFQDSREGASSVLTADGTGFLPLSQSGELTARQGLDNLREQTARQRRDHMQSLLLEDKVLQSRGELVLVADMRQAFADMLTHLGRGLDDLPSVLCKDHNLPEGSEDAIRETIDTHRAAMVAAARKALGDDVTA